MKAIVQDNYCAPDVLQLRETDKPRIGDDEVLVRVRAAGVNPADWAATTGVPSIARAGFGLLKPTNPVGGSDVAGTVEAIGKNVTRLKPGDEVFGAGRGAFAEYAVAAETNLVPKPANVTFEQAAAVPMAGLVALQALRDKGDVQPGQKVLIVGAAGGIGTFAVQIAKAFGAEVTGVCSTSKVDLVRSLGAGHVIDYTKEDFTEGGQRYDFILDNVSSQPLSRIRRALAPDGTLVPNGGRFHRRWLGAAPNLFKAAVLDMFVSQRLRPFLSLPNHDDLVALKELIQAGRVRPVIDSTYPLSEAGKALGRVGEGHARGKVVIRV
jgi:NADPH:quinone reductase-like Zn-dependent oxidoreductase